jgi:RHS repeat-associated protein
MPCVPLPCRSNPRFVGDPIDVVTGANTDAPVDLVQRGPMLFQWVRYYSSARCTTRCSLGWGHSHEFDRLLHRDLDGLRYEDPLGGAVPFQDLALGASEAAGGMVLTRTAEHAYRITQPGQPHQEFHFSPRSDVAPLARLRQGQHTIELRYADNGALCEIGDSWGRLIRVTSDPAGRVLSLAFADLKDGNPGAPLLTYEYDRSGNLIRATDRYRTTLTFAYDSANRMTRRTDRRGYSFHFRYDGEGRCIHSRGDDGLLEVSLDYRPDANTTLVRRGDGGRWTYTYDDSGAITRITDPYGNATKFLLDDLGRPVQEIDPNGNVTRLHYDAFGRHDYRIDPNGHILPAKEADPNPPDPLAYQIPETPLEWEFGHLIDPETVQPARADDPLLALFPAAVVNTVLGKTDTYDATATAPGEQADPADPLTDDFNRPLEHAGPRFVERWKYDANGNLIEHRDRDGSVFRSVYTSWNALSEQLDPLGNLTAFDHTVQGLVAKVTDPDGTVTEYGYDFNENLVEVRSQGRVRETYGRDKAGNIIEKRDANGRTLVTWEIGPANLDRVRLLASGEKHVFAHDAKGRVVRAETPAGKATFTYDDRGRLLSDLRDGKGVSHEFDFHQLVGTTYFSRFKVAYETDDNGDLVVTDPTGGQHRLKISPAGLVVKLLANGARELCQYDAAGRCRRKVLVRNARDSSLWMRGYAYSAAGDLLVVADTKRGTTHYRYDAAHRLVEETLPDGAPRGFGHDGAGNLVRQPGLTDVVLGEGNCLKEANGARFTYNDRDHLSLRQSPSKTVRYEYDDLDMLVRCDISGEPWTATYDAYCRRVQKTWRGRTTTYYWDDFRLAAEVRHDGSARIYVYGDEVSLVPLLFVEYAGLDAAPSSGKRYYVFTNQVGVPVRVENEEGQACWSARLDPYGRAEVDKGTTLEMPLRFPGHYHDVETGLHYNRFRYYSPELGRYLQSDPAGQEGGINLYAYPVNPLTGADIDGLRGRGGGTGRRSGRKGRRPPTGAGAGCARPFEDRVTRADRRLVNQMLKKGPLVLREGDEAYRDAVRRDLYVMASTNTGRRSLEAIRKAGRPIEIRPREPGMAGNRARPRDPAAALWKGSVFEPESGSPIMGTGQGTGSTVFYDPHETRPPGSPAVAGLNHELGGHAKHNATGTNLNGFDSPKSGYPNMEEFSTITNEDNGFRRELGLPPRDGHRDIPS